MYNREKDEKGEEGEVKKIVSYIKAGHPLFYIQHPDFFAMREIIKELKKEFADRKFYEYTNAFGSDAWDSEIFDKDDDSLNIAYINKDKDGYDYLEEIEDKKVFNEAMLVVKDMMSIINKK